MLNDMRRHLEQLDWRSICDAVTATLFAEIRTDDVRVHRCVATNQ
jgi:hypothetical protein